MNVRKLIAGLAFGLTTLVSCTQSDSPTGTKRASGRVSLNLSANVDAGGAATQVALFAGYFTQPVDLSGVHRLSDIPIEVLGGVLAGQIVDLPASGSATIPFSVDLSPCLADQTISHPDGTCPLWVAAVLLSGHNTMPSDPTDFDPGTNELDMDVVGPLNAGTAAVVTPGRSFELHDVATIGLSFPCPEGLSCSQTAPQFLLGQGTTVTATPVDANNAPVSRPVTFASSNNGVATISNTGVIATVAAGTTTISAAAGGRTSSFVLTVLPPPTIVLPADTTTTFTIFQGTSPTNTASTFAVTSSAGAAYQIPLGAVAISYGAGATGWATASLDPTTTPATLSVNTTGTAALTPGTYQAVITLPSTSSVIGSRHVVARLVVNPPPTIVLAADTTLTFTITQGTSPTNSLANFSVASSAGAAFPIPLSPVTITYGAGATGWLTASLSSSTTPATVTGGTTTTGGIPAGTYQAVITVASTNSLIGSRFYVVRLVVNGASTGVSGKVVDGQTGAGIAGATVTGPSGSVATSADGSFTLSSVPGGSTLTIAATGFNSTQFLNVPTGSGAVSAIGNIPLAPTSTATGTVTGRLVDAITGQPIAGATIAVRAGVNATTTTAVQQLTSDASGNFTATLTAGTYTFTGTATNYAAVSNAIAVIGGATLTDQNLVLVPAGSGDVYRIVLTWGANPSDLDSHLTGPTASGTRFHIYYASPSASDADGPIGQLDIDDVTSPAHLQHLYIRECASHGRRQ